MPEYEYECVICKKEFSKVNTIAQLDQGFCCGKMAKKLISITAKPIVMEGWDDNLQEYVTGRAQMRRMERKHGVEQV